MTVGPEQVRAAREVLGDLVRRTPVEPCRLLSERAAGPVLLKCENLQRTGSFKIRGAYHRLSRLDAGQRAAGVVAASAGNHAQGVALAAALLGIRAKVFMPHGTPLPKVQATRGYGAEVEFAGHAVHESIAAAQAAAERDGSVLVHPFDHPDVVAGQGTVGLEILEQVPDVRTVLVPTGGGGLVAGIAAALAGTGVRVVGVQAAGAAAYPASLRAGHPVPLERLSTMADGIAVSRPGEVPFEVLARLGVDVLTVTEEQLSRALLVLLERVKLVVEPAGAAGVAALLDPPAAGAAPVLEPPVVAVLSGGNIDPLLLLRVIEHGMAAAGRYLELRLRLRDRPGSLAALLAVLAGTDVNVLEVQHVRAAPGTAVGEAEVAVRLETQGDRHREQVLTELSAAGYRPVG